MDRHSAAIDSEKGDEAKRVSKTQVAGLVGWIGLVVAVGVPAWQRYIVEKPKLSVEITAISRNLSTAATVSLEDYSELKMLEPYVRRSSYSFNPNRIELPPQSPEDLKGLLDSATKDIEKVLPAEINLWTTGLAKVDSLATLTVEQINELNAPLPFTNEIKVPSIDEFKSKMADYNNNRAYFDQFIAQFRNAYEAELEKRQAKLEKLQAGISPAKQRIEEITTEMTKRHAVFIITAALTNSGRINISVNRPGLLRLYIGRDNYVDLKLEIDKYESSAEIKANGMGIVTLVSQEVSTLPDTDQGLVSTYWNQSVRSILFLQDSLGHVHSSNEIAFAEGVYEKSIYNRLAAEASKPDHFNNSEP